MLAHPAGRRKLILGLGAFVLAVAGVLFFISHQTTLDPAAMSAYFPAREATVAYLDFQTVRVSGILEKLVGSTVGEEAEYKTFVAQTGFDYKRDLDRVMLNSAGGIHYFVLEGRFDWNKLKAWANSSKGGCDGDVCSLPGSTPDRVISFRRLGQNTMALASARDENGVRAIENRRGQKAPFDLPPAPVWVHVTGPAIRSVSGLPIGTRLFAKALEPAESATFTLAPVQERFELSVDVVCRSQEDAAVLKAQLEGLTTLVQKLITREKQTANSADLSGLLTAGVFERTDRHVRGRWPVERAFLDSLGGT